MSKSKGRRAHASASFNQSSTSGINHSHDGVFDGDHWEKQHGGGGGPFFNNNNNFSAPSPTTTSFDPMPQQKQHSGFAFEPPPPFVQPPSNESAEFKLNVENDRLRLEKILLEKKLSVFQEEVTRLLQERDHYRTLLLDEQEAVLKTEQSAIDAKVGLLMEKQKTQRLEEEVRLHASQAQQIQQDMTQFKGLWVQQEKQMLDRVTSLTGDVQRLSVERATLLEQVEKLKFELERVKNLDSTKTNPLENQLLRDEVQTLKLSNKEKAEAISKLEKEKAILEKELSSRPQKEETSKAQAAARQMVDGVYKDLVHLCNTQGAAVFLKHIYSTYPPKDDSVLLDTAPITAQLKRALLVYHEDKQDAIMYGQYWLALCHVICSVINDLRQKMQ